MLECTARLEVISVLADITPGDNSFIVWTEEKCLTDYSYLEMLGSLYTDRTSFRVAPSATSTLIIAMLICKISDFELASQSFWRIYWADIIMVIRCQNYKRTFISRTACTVTVHETMPFSQCLVVHGMTCHIA